MIVVVDECENAEEKSRVMICICLYPVFTWCIFLVFNRREFK